MAGLMYNDESAKIKPIEYELVPLTDRREPAKLYNKECGVCYKSCGKITKRSISSVTAFLHTEVYVLFTILCTIFHQRNNTIEYKSKKVHPNDNDERAIKIRAIFNCNLIDYRFSVNEIYKRYCMRKGVIKKNDQGKYNFWNLSAKEVTHWTQWLKQMGFIHHLNEHLWTISLGKYGKWFLKFTDSKLALAIIQSINALHDSLVVLGQAVSTKEMHLSFDNFIGRQQAKQRYRMC